MAKGYFEDIFGPSSAVDLCIRDGKFGETSPLWESMRVQRKNDAITDALILLAYRICRDNGNNNASILTEPNKGRFLTSLGLQVANIIKNADLVNCRIAQYSINANTVKGELSNNRLSLAVYAHFEEPIIESEVYNKITNEVNTCIIDSIRKLLISKEAQIHICHGYSANCIINNYAELDELLMFGEGSSFPKGYF